VADADATVTGAYFFNPFIPVAFLPAPFSGFLTTGYREGSQTLP
jgi:hypothetical protein